MPCPRNPQVQAPARAKAAGNPRTEVIRGMNTGRIPSVTVIGSKRAQIGATNCVVGEAAEGYVLRAILTTQAAPLAVLEGPEGRLVFASEEGAEVALHPRLEGANTEGFDAEFFERLLEADEDVLGEQVLAAGEPSYQAVAAMLPRVVDDTFVGDPRVGERAIVHPDGSIEGMLEPLTELPWEELKTRGRWGIVARSLLPPSAPTVTSRSSYAGATSRAKASELSTSRGPNKSSRPARRSSTARS